VTLVAPLTDDTDEGKIAEWDGTSLTPTLITPDAGNAVLINCANVSGSPSVNENKAYSFQGAVPTGSWVLFIGATQNHDDLNNLTTGGTDSDAGHTQMVLNTGRDSVEYQKVPGSSSSAGDGYLYLFGRDSGSLFSEDSLGTVLMGSFMAPLTDSTLDMGDASTRWSTGYFDKINVNANAAVGEVAGIELANNADVLALGAGSQIGASDTLGTTEPIASVYANNVFAYTALRGDDANGGALLLSPTSGTKTGTSGIQIDNGTVDLYPLDDVVTALGRAANRWTNVFANTFDAAISIVPETDDTTTMGTNVLRFADLHVVLPTHYGNMTMSGDHTYAPSGNASTGGQIGTDANHFREGHFGPNASSSPIGTDNALTLFGDTEVNGDYSIFPTTDATGTIGVAEAAAIGTLTAADINPIQGGNTVTVDAITYTFDAAVLLNGLAYHILVSANRLTSLQRLRDCLLDNGVGKGTFYSSATPAAHPTVTAAAATGGAASASMVFSAITPGAAGNSIVTLENSGATRLVWTSGTLLGGADALRWSQVICVETVQGDLVMRDPETNGRMASWRLIEQPNSIYAINELTRQQFRIPLEALAEGDYIEWGKRNLSAVA